MRLTNECNFHHPRPLDRPLIEHVSTKHAILKGSLLSRYLLFIPRPKESNKEMPQQLFSYLCNPNLSLTTQLPLLNYLVFLLL